MSQNIQPSHMTLRSGSGKGKTVTQPDGSALDWTNYEGDKVNNGQVTGLPVGSNRYESTSDRGGGGGDTEHPRNVSFTGVPVESDRSGMPDHLPVNLHRMPRSPNTNREGTQPLGQRKSQDVGLSEQSYRLASGHPDNRVSGYLSAGNNRVSGNLSPRSKWVRQVHVKRTQSEHGSFSVDSRLNETVIPGVINIPELLSGIRTPGNMTKNKNCSPGFR